MSFIQEVLTYGNEIVQHALDAMNGCEGNYQQALLLLLLMPKEPSNNLNKEMTGKFFEEYPELKSIPPAKSVIEFILEDNFKDEIYNDTSDMSRWIKLTQLKQKT